MGNLSFLTWLTLGVCLVYIVAVDANVSSWLVLQAKMLRLEAQKAWFRVRWHPDSPWVRYAIRKNADQLAAEMLKDQNDN